MDCSLSPERLSDLIGLIYDCVLDPARWQRTVDALRTQLGFDNAALSVMATPGHGDVLILAASGIEASWLAKLTDYGAEAAELWGGAARRG